MHPHALALNEPSNSSGRVGGLATEPACGKVGPSAIPIRSPSMNPRHFRSTLLAAAAAVTFALPHAGAALADPISAKQEIDHLLNFVGTSPCTFIRNGTEYRADKAREHLSTKYQFAGSQITTAEQFIQHLATQSSMSGERYHVKCGKSDLLSSDWLSSELVRFRKTSTRVQAAR